LAVPFSVYVSSWRHL